MRRCAASDSRSSGQQRGQAVGTLRAHEQPVENGIVERQPAPARAGAGPAALAVGKRLQHAWARG